MTSSTSLSLRALLKTAVTRSGMDSSARLVTGLVPPAQALFVAAAAQSLQHGGAVLLIVPSDAHIEQTVGDVGFFVAALEGLPRAALDRAVLPFPSDDRTH